MAGFEPAIPCSQGRCDGQTSLHLVLMAILTGLEPAFSDRQSEAFPDGNRTLIGGPGGSRIHTLQIKSLVHYRCATGPLSYHFRYAPTESNRLPETLAEAGAAAPLLGGSYNARCVSEEIRMTSPETTCTLKESTYRSSSLGIGRAPILLLYYSRLKNVNRIF